MLPVTSSLYPAPIPPKKECWNASEWMLNEYESCYSSESSDILILWEYVTYYLWHIMSEQTQSSCCTTQVENLVYTTLSKLHLYCDTHSITLGCRIKEVVDVILSKSLFNSSKMSVWQAVDTFVRIKAPMGRGVSDKQNGGGKSKWAFFRIRIGTMDWNVWRPINSKTSR